MAQRDAILYPPQALKFVECRYRGIGRARRLEDRHGIIDRSPDRIAVFPAGRHAVEPGDGGTESA